MRLVIFSGAQSPLSVRYARPADVAKLVLPPLVHRALHTALDAVPPSVALESDPSGSPSSSTLVIPNPTALAKHAFTAQERSETEVTVKIQLVGGTSEGDCLAQIREALALLAERKGVAEVDTVLVGLPGDNENTLWPAVWTELTSVDYPGVKQWGTLGLDQATLAKLCAIKPPAVNELDVTDCTTLPSDYIAFARKEGIQLWAGGGGSGHDPIPAAELHNVLHEFQPVLATVLPNGGALSKRPLVPVVDGRWDASVNPGVAVCWVLSYTLLSRSRNIVKDKGYIVSANLV